MRFALLWWLALALPAASIWVEGEAAEHRQVDPHEGWYGDVNHEALSGGAWLCHFNHERPGTASWRVQVPETATYRLWLRANYHNARLSYRLGDADDADWQAVDFEGGTIRGKTLIGADRKLDIRFLGWVDAGEHRLEAGELSLGVKFHSQNHHHGGVDCLVFTTADWKPFGTDRPPEAAERAPD